MSTRLRDLGPWATPAIAAAEVALVWSGLLGWRLAVAIGVGLEAALWLTALSRAGVGVTRYRRARAGGADIWVAAEEGLAALVPRPLAHFVVLEPRLWVCLMRWLSGHHDGRRADAFAYHRQIGPLLGVAIVLVVIEGAVLDAVLAVVLPGTPWVWAVLGLHVYGLAVLAGIYASFVTRPHLVREDWIVLRDGAFREIVLTRSAVITARVERRANLGRSGFKQPTRAEPAILALGDATVLLTLDASHAVRVEGFPSGRVPHHLAITADDAGGFVRALRRTGLDTEARASGGRPQPVP